MKDSVRLRPHPLEQISLGLSLSTSWNAYRHRDALRMLSEIKGLGFDTVELSFNLTRPMVKSVAKEVRRGALRVTSVHNYCPIPDRIPRALALPDCLSLSSDDEVERERAVRFTKRSIDTAYEVHARCVIIHCGRVAVSDRTRELCALFERSEASSDEFREIKQRSIEQRGALAAGALSNVLRSLDELHLYARGKNIALGIETRFYYREIPSFAELGVILDTFKGAEVYYWHDTGHAQVMENLGFCKHKDFLEAYHGSLLGIHLHDILGCHDHRAPSQGTLDFAMLKPYLSKATYKVLEVHRPAKAEDLKKSALFLRRVFDGAI